MMHSYAETPPSATEVGGFCIPGTPTNGQIDVNQANPRRKAAAATDHQRSWRIPQIPARAAKRSIDGHPSGRNANGEIYVAVNGATPVSDSRLASRPALIRSDAWSRDTSEIPILSHDQSLRRGVRV